MAELQLDDVTIAYEASGAVDEDGEPVVLVCGCGQPAFSWQLGVAPTLTEAGFPVVTFDNRGMAPSSSPPSPYSVDQMVDDTLRLLDHLDIGAAHIVGYSMGGWVAETMAAHHASRVRSAAFLGSCNVGTAWEKAITTVERDLAASEVELPPLFFATETMRYLANHELQDDAVVEAWLTMLGDESPWPNPGRLGQYEACLAWSTDLERTKVWPDIAVPCLVLAFEHDVDSPPARAREAAAIIPGARFVEIAGASHLAPFTHADAVASALVGFITDVAAG